MTVRPGDLPEFGSIAEEHRTVLMGRLGLEDDPEMTGMASLDGEVTASDWIRGLAKSWNGELDKADESTAPHVVPLAEIVRRVSALTGVPCPEIDESEGPHDAARMEEGFDGDG